MSAPGRPQRRFRRTVTDALWQATADACGADFADSYLYGAQQVGQALTPRTLTGYRLMKDNRDFMKLLKIEGLTLREPRPFQFGDNPHTAEDCW